MIAPAPALHDVHSLSFLTWGYPNIAVLAKQPNDEVVPLGTTIITPPRRGGYGHGTVTVRSEVHDRHPGSESHDPPVVVVVVRTMYTADVVVVRRIPSKVHL